MSGGVGLFDCDNDGKLDVVVGERIDSGRFRQGGDCWSRSITRMRIPLTDITSWPA